MQVDPKEAARRLRAWNEYGEGADSGTPNEPGYTHDSLDFQRDLRALLSERDAATARAEAAEEARDAFKRNMEAAADLAARYGNQRDAATAERDRLREALRPQLGKNARRSLEELAEAMEASGDAADATALRFLLERQDAARAALAGVAKEADHG